MKRSICALLALVFVLCLLPVSGFAADNSQTVSTQMPFRVLTGDEMIAEMGTGWNLGNTMDGHTGSTPGETVWQPYKTTQALIKALHDAGFNTIRIPITWGTMMDTTNGYQVDETWMSRVQDIVDYAINMDMYTIINMHHDGADHAYWFDITKEDLTQVDEQYTALWVQIADRFKDYDEHLIFESMNEVYGNDADIPGDTAKICHYNQLFVDAVRSTGSNNTQRWLSVPGRFTNIDATCNEANGFHMPEDTVENRLFLAVHHYDWRFGLLENMNVTEWTLSNSKAMQRMIQQLRKFSDTGIPIIMGEYGAINKYNDADRAYHFEIMNRICQQEGIVPVYWDMGWYDMTRDPDYSFTLIDRSTCELVYPTLVHAIMRGINHPGSTTLEDVVFDPTVTPITALNGVDPVTMTIGDVQSVKLPGVKASSNDVVLWKSSDETVATVCGDISNTLSWSANIHATGIGECVITAFAQSGGASVEIPVTVEPASYGSKTVITLENDSYTVDPGRSFYLNASAEGEGYLTYRSADPSVATVSRLGKVVGIERGTTTITITSSDGVQKEVTVQVGNSTMATEISLALNVYYNDGEAGYFNNEYGQPITVSGDGTYTLSFDADTDLSEDAKAAGVTGLNNLTAIYIKDHDVTLSLSAKSPLVSCDITYDKVVVDGKELTITRPGPKAAMKASGIFDTNDPINSWDGSAVEGVTIDNHVLNFEDLENPQRVEVTFTLENLEFAEVTIPAAKPAREEIRVADTDAALTAGETLAVGSELKALHVVSSDESVVAVEGADGAFQLVGQTEGTAQVRVYTGKGMATVMNVTVEAAPVVETTEATEAPAPTETPAPVKSNDGTLSTVLIVLGILLLGAGVFMATLKIAGGSSKKKD